MLKITTNYVKNVKIIKGNVKTELCALYVNKKER